MESVERRWVQGWPEDVFCRLCGRRLIEEERPGGFNRKTGETILDITTECPGFYERTGFLRLFKKCPGLTMFGYLRG